MSDSGGINNEMTKMAEYASTTAKEKFGCTLDFSEDSLAPLEALLDQAYQRFSQLAKEGKLRNEVVQKTANVWGSYLGEVVRRKWAGTWSRKANDATLEIDGNDIAPIAFVYQRITRQPQYKTLQYYADVTAKLKTRNQKQPQPKVGFLKKIFSKSEPEPAEPQPIDVKAQVEQIVNEGVQLKRQGDFAGAKRAYLRAIQLDPTRRMPIWALAKVCYLLGEQQEAILNYLRAAHLTLPGLAQMVAENPALRQQLGQVAPDVQAHFKHKHKLAPYLLFDSDTPTHLAHAIFDLEHVLPKSDAVKRYIPVYRGVLAGQGGALDDQLDEDGYRPIGIEFLLENIQWQRIDDPQVVEIYPSIDCLGAFVTGKAQNKDSKPLTVGSHEDSNRIPTGMSGGLELHNSWISSCLALLTEKGPICDTLIAIPLDVSQAAFRCPTCGALYISDPITRGRVRPYAEPSETYEMNGHHFEMFDAEEIRKADWHIDQSFQEFLLAKIGPLGRAAEVTALSEQGQGQKVLAQPKNKAFAEMHYRQGIAWLKSRSIEEAIKALQEAIRCDQQHVGAHMLLGQYYGANKQINEAYRELQAVIREEPNNVKARWELVRVYLGQNRLEAEVEELKKIICITPTDPDAYYELGLQCGYLDRYDEAMEYASKAVALGQKSAQDLLSKLNRYREFYLVVANSTDEAAVHHAHGMLHIGKGQFAEAGLEFQKAIELQWTMPEAHYQLGRLYANQKKIDEAIREFEYAVQIDLDHEEAHVELGVLYGEKGLVEEEIAEYLAAPNSARAHYNLGIVFGQQRRIADKITEYRKAIQINPDYLEAHYNLGVTLKREDRYEEALLAFQAVSNLDPNFRDIQACIQICAGHLSLR